MARATLESLPGERPDPEAGSPQGVCLDKGYDYDEVRALAQEFQFTAPIRPRGEEASRIKRQAGCQARRWVVERTHSWLNRFRGLLIRCSKKAENYPALLHLAFGILAGRSPGLLG